jgi:hypothetical protein
MKGMLYVAAAAMAVFFATCTDIWALALHPVLYIP